MKNNYIFQILDSTSLCFQAVSRLFSFSYVGAQKIPYQYIRHRLFIEAAWVYILWKHWAEKPHIGILFPLHLHATLGKSLISLCLSIHLNAKSTTLHRVPQNSFLNRALQSIKSFVSQYYRNVSEENFHEASGKIARVLICRSSLKNPERLYLIGHCNYLNQNT